MRFVLIGFLLLVTGLGAPQAENPPLQFAALGDLELVGGGVLEDVRLGYRTAGRLNIDGSNAILFPTWTRHRGAPLPRARPLRRGRSVPRHRVAAASNARCSPGLGPAALLFVTARCVGAMCVSHRDPVSASRDHPADLPRHTDELVAPVRPTLRAARRLGDSLARYPG